MKSYILYTICLFMGISAISTQAQEIKGRVYDANTKEALPGASVFWENSTVGANCDATGTFKLEQLKGAHELVASFVGYETQTICTHAYAQEHAQKHSQEGHKSGDYLIEIFLQPTSTTFDAVEVKQRRKSAGLSRLSANTVQQITSDELARAACCNLSESFETNASVDVSYADAVSGVKQIQLLGLAGRYSQITLGNVPVLRGAESAFGLEYFPGTWINALQVSKGTSAVKNGYESITGQINLDIKEPFGDERMFFNAYGNQDGKTELNFGYTLDINEKLSTSMIVHGNQNFRELDMNNDGFLDKPMSKMLIAMNQWNYLTKNWESKTGFTYLSDDRKGGQAIYNHDLLASQQDQFYGIGVNIERFNIYTKNGFFFNREATSLGTILSYNYFDRASFYGLNKFNQTQQNLYANLIFASYIGNSQHTYNVGASYNYDNNEAQFSQVLGYKGYKESVAGAFAEYNYIPNQQFTMVLASRYDYSSLHKGFFTPRVHVKYAFLNDITTLRASAGKGYRTPDAVSENSKYMASSKNFYFDEDFKQEEAWNYGFSIANEIPIADRSLSVYLEYYRTDFNNQLVVDMEQNSHEIHFYNLKGKSYSNVFQIEANYEVLKGLDVTAAYRLNDVKTTYNDRLLEAPFTNRYKGLLSLGYNTNNEKWQFDFTTQFNGAQRLPTTANNKAINQRKNESEQYVVMLGQISRKHKNWTFYVGGENLGSYVQEQAIISPESPFDSDFDASRIWAPIYGRMFYAGFKFNLAK